MDILLFWMYFINVLFKVVNTVILKFTNAVLSKTIFRQLTKSQVFRQNDLCDFHLCWICIRALFYSKERVKLPV